MFAKQVLYEDKNIQIRSESKDIATNLREIKRVITEYYEQLYAPKLDNRQILGSTQITKTGSRRNRKSEQS